MVQTEIRRLADCMNARDVLGWGGSAIGGRFLLLFCTWSIQHHKDLEPVCTRAVKFSRAWKLFLVEVAQAGDLL